MNILSLPGIVLTSALLLLWACGPDVTGRDTAMASSTTVQTSPPVAAGASGHAGHSSADDQALTGSGPWTVTTSDGSHVTLTSADAPFGAGQIEVVVSVHSVNELIAAHSIDVVSPTMPMHGVARFPLYHGRALVGLPMEGLWSLYVNLDADGRTSAEFTFAVSAGETPEHTHNDGEMD